MSTQGKDRNRQLFLGLFLVGAGLLVINLSRSIWELRSIRSRVALAEAEVEAIAQENKQLQSEFEWTQSGDFAEQEIRDKLHMSREGEVVLVMPKSTRWSEVEMMGSGVVKVETKIWKRWMELFF